MLRCFEFLKCVEETSVCCYVVDGASLAASHSLFSDPAPPRLTQPLSSRLFLAGEDDEGGDGDAHMTHILNSLSKEWTLAQDG